MNAVATLTHRLHEQEIKLLEKLRIARRNRRAKKSPDVTMGEKIADRVAAVMGSWPFIIIQSVILAIWIVLNITAFMEQWDPYPFILLNLALSFQAAYAAPIIMMSQNRQDSKDRLRGELDYAVNRRAESEIQALSRKLNVLGEKMEDVEELVRASKA
jgi:uncharacterized membrane protein